MKNIVLFVSLLLISCDKEQISKEMVSEDTLLEETKADFRELNDDNLHFFSIPIPEGKVAVILLKHRKQGDNMHLINCFRIRRNMLRRLKNQNSKKIDFIHVVPVDDAKGVRTKDVRTRLSVLWSMWRNSSRIRESSINEPVVFFLIGDEVRVYEVINEERTCLDDLQTIIDSIDYL